MSVVYKGYGDTVYGNNVDRLIPFRKFGQNSAIAATQTLVATAGGTTPYLPSTAQSMEIVSSDAADASAGAGARTVTVIGLDANWKVQEETLTMNGITAVASTKTWLRIYRAYVATCGTYAASNVGVITIRVGSAGTTFVVIAAGNGQTETTHYCTAAEETYYINDAHFAVDSNKPVNFTSWVVYNTNTATATRRVIHTCSGVAAGLEYQYDPPVAIPPYSDIYITATATGGGGAGSVDYNGFIARGVFKI